MLVTELGEFGLIKRFSRKIKTDPSVWKGSGDDCAVLKYGPKNYQLFTCDMLVEGTDFTLRDNPYLIGRKALAVSLSDIAACAGLPRYCVISLAFPKSASVAFLDKLFQGMLKIAREYRLNIVGGDISRGRQLTIDVSMLGVVEKERLVLRSGAKAGDLIFVTGRLGGSIFGKHLNFTPRIKEARFLVEKSRVHAMIDISDGLAQDLGHILSASNTGAVIYEALIPLAKKARSLKDALYMGEDFELLFTSPPKEAKKFLKQKAMSFYPIGEIKSKDFAFRLEDKKGRQQIIKAKGFQHF